MLALVASEFDYIAFCAGLGLILLAAMTAALGDEDRRALPWAWFAGWALLQGVVEWLELLEINLGDNGQWGLIAAIGSAISYLLLVEFGRQGLESLGYRAPGRWIFVPILLILLTSALGGVTALQFAALCLGLAGTLFSARVFWGYAQTEVVRLRPLVVLAIGMAVYGVIEFVDPTWDVLSAAMLFESNLLQPVTILVQIGQTVTTLVMVLALWRFAVRSRRREMRRASSLVTLEILLLLALLGSLLLGWVVTDWATGNATQQQASELIRHVQLAAAGITEEQLAPLTGTAQDAGTPTYEAIKAQLVRLRDVNPEVRFVYLVGQSNGQLIFLVDAEPPDSPDYSPPGEVYGEATAQLKSSFTQPESFVEGPLADHWGNWVTAFTPITDDQGNVLAVLGIDIDATTWLALVAQKRLMPILITLLISMLLVLFYIAQRWMQTARDSKLRLASEQTLLLDTIETQVWYLKDAETYGPVNQAHASFMGKPKQLLEQQRIADVLPADVATRWIDTNRTVFAAGRPEHDEFESLDGAGLPRSLSITRTPKMGEDGKVEFVVCTAVTSPVRKLTEQRLAEILDLNQTMVESSLLGMIAYRSDTGKCVMANTAAARAVGATVEQLVQQNFRELRSWRESGFGRPCGGSAWRPMKNDGSLRP
ncbi:MAG: PAS domain-containing protein [Anaerolineales bacterium]|nr:PAS domain-containing protein [Anaerolineales bacterium]